MNKRIDPKVIICLSTISFFEQRQLTKVLSKYLTKVVALCVFSFKNEVMFKLCHISIHLYDT